MSTQQQQIVNLNVGGRCFSTSLSTLQRIPESMLGRMFSNDQKIRLSTDEKGRVFIDRDGDIFRHVLNFLRADIIPSSPEVREALRHEADFFQIIPLISALETSSSSFPTASSVDAIEQQRIKQTPLYQYLQESILRSIQEAKKSGFTGIEIAWDRSEVPFLGPHQEVGDVLGLVNFELRSQGFFGEGFRRDEFYSETSTWEWCHWAEFRNFFQVVFKLEATHLPPGACFHGID